MAAARQLHILALVLLHQLLVVEPLGVGQVDHEAYLHLVRLHGLEQHVGGEPVLRGNLVVETLVKWSLERQEPGNKPPACQNICTSTVPV